MDDVEHDVNKRSDKTYMSKSLPAFHDKEAKVRIATKAFDKSAERTFAMMNGELVVRECEGGQRIVKAIFLGRSQSLDPQPASLHQRNWLASKGKPRFGQWMR